MPWNIKEKFTKFKKRIGGPILTRHSKKVDKVGLKLGRLGFITRGFVWACIGGVAVSAAFTGHKTESQVGALGVVAESTAGTVVLILATLGIFCYAGWRCFEFLYGLRSGLTDNRAKNFINTYLVPLASLIFYMAFAAGNIATIVHGRKYNDDNDNQDDGGFWQDVADNVAGRIVLTCAAVVLWGVGFGWIAMMIRRKPLIEVGIDREKLDKITWVKWVFFVTAYLGTAGRIFLFMLLGVLFCRIAWADLPGGGGFGDALHQLQTNTGGKVVLVFDGILLIIFGCWSIMMSRYKIFLPYEAHMIPKDTRAKIGRQYSKGKEKFKSAFRRQGSGETDGKKSPEESGSSISTGQTPPDSEVAIPMPEKEEIRQDQPPSV